MTINYEPVQVTGGAPNLPYRLEPALSANEDSKVFKPTKPLWDYVTKHTILLPLTLYVFISAAMKPAPALPLLVFSAFGAYLLSRLALRASIPAFLGSVVLAMFYFGITLPGATSLLMLTFICAFVVGVRNRFTKGVPDTALRYRGGNGFATLEQSMKPTWGTAGAHIGSNTTFGDAAVAGAKGEVAVGQALEAFAKSYPYVRVFHGLCFTPGKQGADVDHAVLIGDKVILVDAKFWAFGNYYWNHDGTVARDGQSFAGSEVHMDSALQKWRAFLGKNATYMDARIAVAKTPMGNFTYNIDNSRAPRGVALTTIPELVASLKAIADATEPVVNRRLVYLISGELQ